MRFRSLKNPNNVNDLISSGEVDAESEDEDDEDDDCKKSMDEVDSALCIYKVLIIRS